MIGTLGIAREQILYIGYNSEYEKRGAILSRLDVDGSKIDLATL